jgi:hypothetical protein
VRFVATGLLAFANLLAVIDGVMQDKGLHPSSRGRTGFRRFGRQLP